MHRTIGYPQARPLSALSLLLAQLLMLSEAAAQEAPAAPARAPASAASPKQPAKPAPAAPAPAAPAPAAPTPAAPAPTAPAAAPDAAEAPPAAEAAPAPEPAPGEPVAERTPEASSSAGQSLAPAPSHASSAVQSYPVKLISPVPGLRLELHRFQLGDVTHGPTKDHAAFSEACTAPCETSVEAGAYQLAFSTPAGDRASADQGLLLQGPTTISADVISHADTRRRGWYWVLVGTGIGALATTVGLAQNCGTDHDCAKSASLGIWGGMTAMSVAWVIGIPMIATEDEATITITPGLGTGSQGPDVQAASFTGATASGRF